jgi:hypothetical protein
MFCKGERTFEFRRHLRSQGEYLFDYYKHGAPLEPNCVCDFLGRDIDQIKMLFRTP